MDAMQMVAHATAAELHQPKQNTSFPKQAIWHCKSAAFAADRKIDFPVNCPSTPGASFALSQKYARA
jgi:hypothetical protein